MNIVYRNFTADDIDQIIKFWNENSGWETTLDRDEFNRRFCSSFAGDPIIMIAIDNDTPEIVGLFCFIPLFVTVNNKEGKCYRPFGAVFRESFRAKFGLGSFLAGSHPLQKLYKKGTELAMDQNAIITYMIPDPRWGKILKTMPFELCQLPLWSHKLPLDEKDLDFPIDIRNIDLTSGDIDNLWIQSSKEGLCTLTRNAKFYQWKIALSHDRYKLRGVYDDDRLIGLFTFHFKPSEHQWIIGDILTLDNDESLTLTLLAACSTIQKEYLQIEVKPDKTYKAAILATPLIEGMVKKIGFYKDNYNFTLAVHLLDKKRISKSTVAPENWYVSAND